MFEAWLLGSSLPIQGPQCADHLHFNISIDFASQAHDAYLCHHCMFHSAISWLPLLVIMLECQEKCHGFSAGSFSWGLATMSSMAHRLVSQWAEKWCDNWQTDAGIAAWSWSARLFVRTVHIILFVNIGATEIGDTLWLAAEHRQSMRWVLISSHLRTH